MTIKWPALKAALEAHTVATSRGLMSGFLVRCTSSRKELGYVWQAGSAWRWQTPDGANRGERSSQRAAVEVLRDAHDVRAGGTPTATTLPFDDAPITLPTTARPMKPRAPRPTTGSEPVRNRVVTPKVEPPPPPVPEKRIVWGEQTGDLTQAVADALRRRTP
jgi:hypothetical protein